MVVVGHAKGCGGRSQAYRPRFREAPHGRHACHRDAGSDRQLPHRHELDRVSGGAVDTRRAAARSRCPASGGYGRASWIAVAYFAAGHAERGIAFRGLAVVAAIGAWFTTGPPLDKNEPAAAERHTSS